MNLSYRHPITVDICHPIKVNKPFYGVQRPAPHSTPPLLRLCANIGAKKKKKTEQNNEWMFVCCNRLFCLGSLAFQFCNKCANMKTNAFSSRWCSRKYDNNRCFLNLLGRKAPSRHNCFRLTTLHRRFVALTVFIWLFPSPVIMI